MIKKWPPEGPRPWAIIISASQYYAMLICTAMDYLVYKVRLCSTLCYRNIYCKYI